ncbi:MAG: LON peptidase substrate-binding domain-containing protein [Candidatus Eremiobacteraeota bacterium]|nr:LON peptidase substrate-binding domain-containing protein [Candidatus Eremiobacteraeota bacterium]
MLKRLRLFPLNSVLFPGAVLNLHIFEPRYQQMIGECLKSAEGFGVVLIRDGDEAGDPSVTPHQVGAIAEILEVTPLPFGRSYVSTIGRRRFRITQILSREPFLTAEAELLEEGAIDESELEELTANVRGLFLEYVGMLVEFSGQPTTIEIPGDAQSTSYIVGDALQIAQTMKQRLLEVNDTKQRLTVELSFLRRLLPQLRKLLERNQAQSEHPDAARSQPLRNEQEKLFGKYFSVN